MKRPASSTPSAASAADNTTASTIRESLSPIVPILDAFNHRHKNQHRSSHWWSRFNSLRRSVRAICGSKKYASSEILNRGRWLRDVVIPNSYVPFTQLVADSQHAPLGLMLVAVLARIAALLTEILPVDSIPVATLIANPTDTSTDETFAAVHLDDSAGPDKGIAVERSSVTPTSKPSSPKPSEEQKTASKRKLRTTDLAARGGKPEKKKKTKSSKKGDDFSSMFSSLS